MTTQEIIAKWKSRPMSWSQLSSFLCNPAIGAAYGSPEKWYRSYILGERESSPQLAFGTIIDKKIQDDPSFMPTLPRYVHMQYKLEAALKSIELIGLPDGLDLAFMKLADYKTGKQPWDQKRADKTGQLTFYLMLIYLIFKIRPENFDLFIHWLPTGNDSLRSIALIDGCKPVTFKTKRTLPDVLKMMDLIVETRKNMEDYIRSYPH